MENFGFWGGLKRKRDCERGSAVGGAEGDATHSQPAICEVTRSIMSLPLNKHKSKKSLKETHHPHTHKITAGLRTGNEVGGLTQLTGI